MTEKKNAGHLMPVPAVRQDLISPASNAASNSIIEAPVWEPTKKQALFLEALAEVGLNRTIKAVCEEAGCTPASYHLWKKQPGFLMACQEVACQIVQTAVPMTLSAMGQEAAGGNTSAARLILQAAGLIGSGCTEVHFGDKIGRQLNVHGQQPGQQPQGYGDHRDVVFRAADPSQFDIAVEIGNRVAAEMLAREERGEPELTDMQQLAAIKRGSELVIAERAAKEAGQAEVIDVPPIEQAETD